MTDPSNQSSAEMTGSISGDAENLRSKTVSDFGEQWTYFTQNDGYYASDAFFADLLDPLLSPADFNGITCAKIGAGTGNIAAMALRAGAAHFTAVEPSDAVGPLRKNLAEFGTRASVAHVLGENIPKNDFDMVTSIGVLHHIPKPDPVVKAAPDRRLVIVDQLKPAAALYYTEAEARDLLERAGFSDIELHHRHGYSWSVLGHKPSVAP